MYRKKEWQWTQSLRILSSWEQTSPGPLCSEIRRAIQHSHVTSFKVDPLHTEGSASWSVRAALGPVVFLAVLSHASWV